MKWEKECTALSMQWLTRHVSSGNVSCCYLLSTFLGLGSRDTEISTTQSKEKEGTEGSIPKTRQKAVCTNPAKKVFVLPFHKGGN